MAAGRGVGLRHLAPAPGGQPVAHAAHPPGGRHRRQRVAVGPASTTPTRPRSRSRSTVPSRALVTERVNQPLVMTPWELEHALDLLLRELDGSDPAVAAALARPRPPASSGRGGRRGPASATPPTAGTTSPALRDEADAAVAAAAGGRSTAERCAGGGGDPSARAPRRGRPGPRRGPARRAAGAEPDDRRADARRAGDRPAGVRGVVAALGEHAAVRDAGACPRTVHRRRREPPRHRVGARAAPARATTGRRTAWSRPTRRRRSPTRSGARFAAQLRDRDGEPADGRRRCGCWRRRRRTRCGCRSSPRCSPTPASSTCTAIPARRSAACSTRGGRAASSPTPTCPGGASRRGRCCSSPDGGSSSAGRSAEIVATQWATATERAARRPRAARPRPVVRHQLRRASSPTRRPRSARLCGVLRRRVGRHAGGRAPAGAPHPRLPRSRQVAPQRRRARPVLGPGPRGRGACARRVRLRRHASRRCAGRHRPPRRPTADRRPRRRRPRPTAPPEHLRQRAHHVVPGAARRRSARRCWSRPTRAGASSSSAPTARAQHPLPVLPESRWAWPARRRARRRHARRRSQRFQNQPALSARLDPPGRARRLLRAARPRTSPATSGSTTSRSPATSCGSVEHPLLVPGHARRRPQLRPAVAAAVRHRAGRRGPLPPQRLAVVDDEPQLRHRARRHRRAASGWRDDKTSGGVVLDVDVGRGRRRRALHAALAAVARRAALGARVGQRARSAIVDLERGARRGRSTRVPGFTRGLSFAGPLRVRRAVAGARARSSRASR